MNKKLFLAIFIAFFFCLITIVPQISNCQTADTLTVVLNSPLDSASSATFSNVFSYIPTITGVSDYFVSATLYINGTATTYVNSTAIVNGAANTISYVFTSNGVSTWNVLVSNSSGSAFATANYTLTVNVPTPTPTATPTATANATASASPTATESPTTRPTTTPRRTATPTIEPTPTEEEAAESPLDLFLIIGIVAVAVAVIGVAVFLVLKRRGGGGNEKSLRKYPYSKFQDWVIKKFNGKPGDPSSGIDGYTEGGQPLSIKQADNVTLAEVDDFAAVLARGRAQKGTIVAFSFDNDAMEGKAKAMDRGIEIEMLSIYELTNKHYTGKINDIARSQVTFDAVNAYPAEEQEMQPYGELPVEPQIAGLKKPVVFISFSNTKIVEQAKKLLDFLHYEYVMGDNEETTLPISENKFGLMKDCDCAIINISAIEQERRYSGIYVLNSNVITEISGAFLKYNTQVILLVERKVQLPSNIQGLKRIEYEDDELSFDAAMELQKTLAEFKKL
jgi:hypothetical protein